MWPGIHKKELKTLYYIVFTIMLIAASAVTMAQEPPPRPIVVTATAQGLSFGAFYHGAAGGTVIISSIGARSATGDVVLLTLGYSFSTALYNIVGNPGTLISLLNGSDVPLAGSNGGSITLSIGVSNPLSPFVLTQLYPVPTQLNVGGTITILNSALNPPGSYSGTFNITFIQE